MEKVGAIRCEFSMKPTSPKGSHPTACPHPSYFSLPIFIHKKGGICTLNMALQDYIPTGPHQNQPPANYIPQHHPSDYWHDQLFHLQRHFSIHIQRGSGEASAPFLNQTQVGNYYLVYLPHCCQKSQRERFWSQSLSFWQETSTLTRSNLDLKENSPQKRHWCLW